MTIAIRLSEALRPCSISTAGEKNVLIEGDGSTGRLALTRRARWSD